MELLKNSLQGEHFQKLTFTCGRGEQIFYLSVSKVRAFISFDVSIIVCRLMIGQHFYKVRVISPPVALCCCSWYSLTSFFFLPVLSCRLNYFSEQKHKIHILKEYLYTCGWSQTAWLCWFLISYFSRSFSAFPSCWTADQDLLYRAESQRNISIIKKWGSIQSKWSTYPVFIWYSC